MNRKPRILLIPNVSWWIIGEMGKQIIARFRDKYDFYFLPEPLLERRPDMLRAMIPAIDAIHCLNESSIGFFRDLDQEALPPIATWIHHVTTWSPDHQMAVDRSSALTVCTSGWKRYLEERVSSRVPILVVPHGVDTKFFQRKKVHPGRFGIPADHFVIGFLGSKGSDRDHGRKGTDVLLDVVHKVANLVPNLHIVLGGPGWEKEMTELRQSGVSASATGYIRKSDLPALYSALDVYLLTSRVEGGPCTVFEAMACGTAVVSTRVGAVPELIVDGINGYSTNVDDREALVSAIMTLDQLPEKRNKIAENGRETVASRAWASALSPLEEVYDELIQCRRKTGLPLPGPVWMNAPETILRVSCAADTLLTVYTGVRKGSMSVTKGVRMLHELPIIDIARGAAMAREISFKVSAPRS